MKHSSIQSSTFFFSTPLSHERINWYTECIASGAGIEPGQKRAFTVFITGDALFSFVDAQSREAWNALSEVPSVQIVADGDELRLHGLGDSVGATSPGITITERGGGTLFWGQLVSHLAAEWKGTKKAGFLLCHPPYMSRIPVHMLRFLSGAHAAGLSPELYAYLDGLHNIHNGQRPSEFENIGRAIATLARKAGQSGKDPWFAACSRCATARGYFQMNPGTGYCEPASSIDEITIRPLKEILSRFPGFYPILSHTSGGIVNPDRSRDQETQPRLIIFITNPPYGTEWTFGGLSLALATAMEGIPTTVVFIEHGVYSLYGTHEVPPNDKVFNVQEMVAATLDIPSLCYLVHAPSLERRGIGVEEHLIGIREVQNNDLAQILWDHDYSATRILFF